MNQTSLKLWRKRITDQRASCLKVAEWCEKNNLSKHAYYYWRKRIECVEGDSLEITKMPVFAELKPTLRAMNETESQLQISTKDGYVFSMSIRGANKEMKSHVLDDTGYEWLGTDYKRKSRRYPRTIHVTSNTGKKIDKIVDEKQVVFWSKKICRPRKGRPGSGSR